jgi:radical SAM superfamily enzyme YgiQ (UPF0313 family)
MGNPSWEDSTTRILIARLSPWRDVDISTSHLILFEEARKARPDAFIDFAFLPTVADRRKLDNLGLPWFFGRASRKGPADFDLVMVSNAYTLETVNLPWLLAKSGLPLSARERALRDDMPIIVAGGSNASAMGAVVQMPENGLGPALDSFVDGIFFGEGEDAIGPLATILGTAGRSAPARQKALGEAQAIEGFWACLLGEKADKATAADMPRTLANPLILNGTSASTVRLAITSGCPGYCSFCLEGWDRRPYREASLEQLVSTAKKLRQASGADELEIYSYNFNTHSDIFKLIYELNRIFWNVSFMSQRLDLLADTDNLVEAELAGGKRSFTLGIEGISSRMRAYYRKGLSSGQLSACIDKTVRKGVKEVKLFFIISGMESEKDFDEFDSLMVKAAARKLVAASGTRIVVSAGYLVRLPFTPLQYAPLEFDIPKLERISFRIDEICSRNGIEYRLASDADEYRVDQALSLGGNPAFSWLGKVVERGIVYDKGIGGKAWPSLERVLLQNESGAAFLGEKTREYRPPLSFIAESKLFESLWDHYAAARDYRDRKSCLGARCGACGACPSPEDIQFMTGHEIRKPDTPEFVPKIQALLAAKANFPSILAEVTVPQELAQAGKSYRDAWLLKREMSGGSARGKSLFVLRESLFSEECAFSELMNPGLSWYGKTLARFAGPKLDVSQSVAIPSWIKAQIDIPLAFRDMAEKALKGFLETNSVGFTLRRSEKGTTCEVSHTALGRKIARSAGVSDNGDYLTMELELGPKARLAPLVSELAAGGVLEPRLRITGWA